MDMTGLRALGVHVAEREDELLEAAAPDEEARRRLAARAAGRRPAGAWRRHAPASAVAALVGVACGLAASSLWPVHGDPLAFTVGDSHRTGVVRAWESAPASKPLPIRFSDGTSVTLEPNARARVVRVAEDGADLVIESGGALFDVAGNGDANWQVRTGPFVVEVTGTRFAVSWNPERERFALSLFEGHVVVSGCALGRRHPVEAGQRLEASCRDGTLEVGKIDQPKLVDAPRATANDVRAPAGEPAKLPAPPRAGKGSPARMESWQHLAGRGRYDRAYEVASRRGFEAACERATAEELLLLADSARLTGHAGRARLAYATARQRFPGSRVAARSAFALGRAAFQSGDKAGAASWLEAYLAERPAGPLAGAALGRLLEAYVALGNHTRAEAVAETYVHRYPGGPRADQARRILQRARPLDH